MLHLLCDIEVLPSKLRLNNILHLRLSLQKKKKECNDAEQ